MMMTENVRNLRRRSVNFTVGRSSSENACKSPWAHRAGDPQGLNRSKCERERAQQGLKVDAKFRRGGSWARKRLAGCHLTTRGEVRRATS